MKDQNLTVGNNQTDWDCFNHILENDINLSVPSVTIDQVGGFHFIEAADAEPHLKCNNYAYRILLVSPKEVAAETKCNLTKCKKGTGI